MRDEKDCCKKICNYCQDIVEIHKNDPSAKNIATIPALAMLFVQIGETVKDAAYKNIKLPDGINWKEAAKMRDKIVHHYGGIDYRMMVRTINKDILEILEITKKASE